MITAVTLLQSPGQSPQRVSLQIRMAGDGDDLGVEQVDRHRSRPRVIRRPARPRPFARLDSSGRVEPGDAGGHHGPGPWLGAAREVGG